MIFTPDKAKQFLPLLKDLADGVVLERRDTSLGWGITTAIDTQEDPARYRRKPEPRRVRVWVNRNTGEVGDKYTGPLPACSEVLAALEGWYAPEFLEVL